MPPGICAENIVVPKNCSVARLASDFARPAVKPGSTAGGDARRCAFAMKAMNKLRPLLIALLLPLLAAVGAHGEISSSAIPGQPLTDDEIKATLQDCVVTDHWGEAMFQGKLNRTHTKISGRVIQDGHSVSVTLRRADPKPVPAKAEPQVLRN